MSYTSKIPSQAFSSIVKTKLFASFLAVGLSGSLASPTLGQVPTTIANVTDGTIADIAASKGFVWIAQGRTLAIYQVGTFVPTRVPALEVTYSNTLTAVEYNEVDNLLYVAAGNELNIYDLNVSFVPKVWTEPVSTDKISDVKYFAGSDLVVLLDSSGIKILDHSQSSIFVLSAAPTPTRHNALRRLELHDDGVNSYAYAIGPLAAYPSRDLDGFSIFNLNKPLQYGLIRLTNFWDPVVAIGMAQNFKASVRAIKIISNVGSSGNEVHAYVAASLDIQGQPWLPCIDVTNPASPLLIHNQVSLSVPGCASYTGDGAVNLAVNETNGRLLVASTNRLHTVDPVTQTELAAQDVEFFDAGRWDMAFVDYPSSNLSVLWTGISHSVEYCLQAFDVTANQPSLLWKDWWISSSDGAVAVPDWDSVYLPTFRGIARYDISDETNQVRIDDSFQTTDKITEHIAYLETGAGEGVLFTARGVGGVDSWKVSSISPNPEPKVTGFASPAFPGTNISYSNGVEGYESEGKFFALVDVTVEDAAGVLGKGYVLQAYPYDPSSINCFSNPVETSIQWQALPGPPHGLSNNVSVWSHYAFVGGENLFFVVDLAGLTSATPTISVVDKIFLRGYDGVRGIACNGSNVFVSLDGNATGGAIQSYTFDPLTGDVGGSGDTILSQLTSSTIPGLQPSSRVRFSQDGSRIYVCDRDGRLIEVDITTPGMLSHLSTWRSPWKGESQDCRTYMKAPGEPRILFVKNNEAFAILKPQ